MELSAMVGCGFGEKRKRWRAVLFAACLTVVAGPTQAQDAQGGGVTASGEDADALRPIVDRIIGNAVARESIPGLIVGVSWRGRRSFFGYSGTGSAAYGPETIVEIGSITKVFTTALFAEAVREGRLRRDAPLQTLLSQMPLKPCAGQVTPLQLADFTSGMPELPGNVPRALAERGIDRYTERDFLSWLERWAPEGSGDGSCALPAPYRYSNASVGLLGLIVAESFGTNWETLLRERITGPLRMASTAVSVPDGQRGRLAQGYGADGQPVIGWPVFAWYAAGALRSSATDMLAFGEAALGHERAGGATVPPLLGRALADAMAPIYRPEGQNFGQGMAWVEDVGDPDTGQRPVYYKAGGTDGFNSAIVINPGKDLAIFVSGSRPKAGVPQLGVELSRQIR